MSINGEGTQLNIGVLKERADGEKRVALVPESAKALAEKGASVLIEIGAGADAGFVDSDYQEAGATVHASPDEIVAASNVILQVLGPIDGHAATLARSLKPGDTLIALLNPTGHLDMVRALCERKAISFSMDLIPRITRAQSMDALSSMSTIAGYRGALLAAERLPRFFPMLMTAAGTLSPARILVIGAGVAGLQAIATCKRLGAVVEAFDVRPAVKEQVESLGARFVSLSMHLDDAEDASGYAKEVSGDTHVKELELIASRIDRYDAVITTALIPGKSAPVLITREMLKKMPRGSVIVDLAATAGGNCEATVPGQTVVADGVTVIGSTSLLSDMASDASRMYSRNISEFLNLLVKDGETNVDLDDPIIAGTLVTHEGRIVHEPTRLLIEGHK